MTGFMDYKTPAAALTAAVEHVIEAQASPEYQSMRLVEVHFGQRADADGGGLYYYTLRYSLDVANGKRQGRGDPEGWSRLVLQSWEQVFQAIPASPRL